MTLNTPSSVKLGVRPMMVSTRPYSSELRPKLRARVSSTVGFMKPGLRCREGVEQWFAVGAAHQRVHQVLGVGHQAEDAEVGAEDAGDGAGAAVQVCFGRQVAGSG